MYSTFFWLGSLTRYQPVELFKALNGPEGAFFREFIETRPNQLLYMLAADVKQQDVTRGDHLELTNAFRYFEGAIFRRESNPCPDPLLRREQAK